MFYGSYEYYKGLKHGNINKDDEEVLSAEKMYPEWKYKIVREEINHLIKYYHTFSILNRFETVEQLVNQRLITSEYAIKLLELENIK